MYSLIDIHNHENPVGFETEYLSQKKQNILSPNCFMHIGRYAFEI